MKTCNESYIRLYDNYLPLLHNRLMTAEFKLFLCLGSYVCADCIIHKTKNQNSAILTMYEIPEVTGVKYDNLRQLFKHLQNKGLIAKHDVTDILPDYHGKTKYAYTVNPFIYHRGNEINDIVYNYYTNINWEKLIQQ